MISTASLTVTETHYDEMKESQLAERYPFLPSNRRIDAHAFVVLIMFRIKE